MKRWISTVLAVALFAPAAARAQEEDVPLPPSFDARAAPELEEGFKVPPHRFAYAGSAVFLLGGLGMSYWANGNALRSEGVESAVDAQENIRAARQSAATANFFYALAGVTLAYGLVMELLPEDARDAADLTFHF